MGSDIFHPEYSDGTQRHQLNGGGLQSFGEAKEPLDPANFVYADTAFGDVNRRNHIRRVDTLRARGRTDCYASYGRATDALVAWVNTHKNRNGNPTVAGFDGPTWTPFLPLDFDHEHDPAVALGWVRRTLGWLDGEGVDLGAVRVYFSGGKGFHVEIPHALFGGFAPSTELPGRLKRAAEWVLRDIPFDGSVYDRLRLWRLEGTKNGKGGFFKVRLTIREARTLDLAAIRALAGAPRDTAAIPELAPVSDDDWLPVPSLADVWGRAAIEPAPDWSFEPAHDRSEPTGDERVGLTVAAIAESWPAPVPGESPKQHISRHAEYLMPLAGFLAGHLDAQAIRSVLEAAAEAAEDRSFLDGRDWRAEMARIAEDSARKRARGKRVRGLPTLGARFAGLARVLGALWPSTPAADRAAGGQGAAYVARDGCLYWRKPTKDGEALTLLANFTAQIVGDVAIDDGAEARRMLELAATVRGRSYRVTLPAERFPAMSWPMEYLGAGAIVSPGMGLRDHARAAIQELSGDVPSRTIYGHLGWREVGGTWAYLHAGGAIGPNGPLPSVDVQAPEALARFVLPDPPEPDALRDDVRASLAVLDVAPDVVTVPNLGAAYRAPLGGSDFVVHNAGPSGAGKSELTALGQQHFGAGLDARHLPGWWSSTGNALEALAFATKDAVLAVDDFAPTGSAADVQRYHRDADRVFRAQGNNAGRLRLRADATLRAARPPRGIIVSTGEDVPRGQSLRARGLIVEVEPDAVRWDHLTAAQADAADGRYARALAGYVRWLAGRYADVPIAVRADVVALRAAAATSGAHRRTPEIVANLATGWRWWLSYAVDVGAIGADQAAGYWRRAWVALGASAADQDAHQRASEPTARYFELLGSALASGRAHVADANGESPLAPGAWGWRERSVGAGEHARTEWQAQGQRVGWLDAQGLYLEPDAALAAVQAVGTLTGDPLMVGQKTLSKRLHERGLLLGAERERGRYTVRRELEGRRRNVLHVRADALDAHDAEHAQGSARTTRSAHMPIDAAAPTWTAVGSGPFSWADPALGALGSAHENGPGGERDRGGHDEDGPFGPILEGDTHRRDAPPRDASWCCTGCRALERRPIAEGLWRCGACGARTDDTGRVRCGTCDGPAEDGQKLRCLACVREAGGTA